MQRVLLLLSICLLAVACGHRQDAKTFETALETALGAQFKIVKLDTEKGEYVVYQNQTTGEYVAYNLAKWDRKTMTTVDQYLAAGAVDGVDIVRGLNQGKEWVTSGYWRDVYVTDWDWVYDSTCQCDRYVSEQVWAGQEWVDTSHWYTYYVGGGFRFDNTSSQSRDLDTLAALQDQAAEQFMAQRLKSQFSLSADRAGELAKLANRYQKLENARELTAAEKDQFAMSALGVSMSQVESAVQNRAQGNEARYQQLLNTAARVNNTTPEQIGRFFDEMVTDQI